MWNLKNKTNEQTEQKPAHRYREQTGGCQRGGGWVKQAKGIKRYKLSVMK